MTSTSIQHPTIGNIAGAQGDGVVQFRGIRYATLQDRFAAAELARYDGSGLDATHLGPQVISPPGGLDMEYSFIQHALPKPDFPGTSETLGLNLIITIPESPRQPTHRGNLPVLVFLHGGGFAIGSNWWPQYDFSRLVKLASRKGQPVIGVNVNYRLGALGFMTTPELRAAGYKINNGLRDQRVALQWVKEYIAGFGGNPQNVTVMGESAGGVSAGYLLWSQEPLANRIICLGGCPPLLGQLSLEAADAVGKSAQNWLGLGDVPASNPVQALLSLPADDFWSKIPPSENFGPVIDGDIIPESITIASWAQTPSWKRTSIEAILVGDSELDSSIMGYMLLHRKAELGAAFRAVAEKTLHGHPKALQAVLEHYSLTESAEGTVTPEQTFSRVLRFISDVGFLVPAVELAVRFPGTSYVYAFNERNPWDGLFKGQASHILDVAFIFQNYNEHLDEAQRVAAETFGQDIIVFANGGAPWPSFNGGNHGVAVYEGGKREFAEPPAPETTKRDPFIFTVQKEMGVTADELMAIFNNLIMSH